MSLDSLQTLCFHAHSLCQVPPVRNHLLQLDQNLVQTYTLICRITHDTPTCTYNTFSLRCKYALIPAGLRCSAGRVFTTASCRRMAYSTLSDWVCGGRGVEDTSGPTSAYVISYACACEFVYRAMQFFRKRYIIIAIIITLLYQGIFFIPTTSDCYLHFSHPLLWRKYNVTRFYNKEKTFTFLYTIH